MISKSFLKPFPLLFEVRGRINPPMADYLSHIRRPRFLNALFKPVPSQSQQSRQALILGFLSTIIAFSIYFLTLAPDITWANFSSDGGELITAAVTLGIPHPPGYPTYTLLGKFISFFRIGTVAYQFNLFSAISASLAAGFVTATCVEYLRKVPYGRMAAFSAGLTFAFTPLVWSQAVVTEVYTLNLLFVAATLWAFFGRRSSLLVGILSGLSVSTHLTSLFLLPMFLALTNKGERNRFAASILIGLTPFLTIPILARGNSPVIWGNPESFSGWLWLISGRLYQANIGFPEPGELVANLSSWSQSAVYQFALVGWLVIAWGIVIDKHQKRIIAIILLTAAGYFIFSFIYQTPDSLLLILPAFVLLSLSLATGFTKLKQWSFVFPLILLILNFNQQNLSQNHAIRSQVNMIFNQIPQDAIVITPGDPSIFTLWYFNLVENQRPDITLVDSNLFAFDWYRRQLENQHPQLKGVDADNLNLFVKSNSNRTICSVSVAHADSTICHPPLIKYDN